MLPYEQQFAGSKSTFVINGRYAARVVNLLIQISGPANQGVELNLGGDRGFFDDAGFGWRSAGLCRMQQQNLIVFHSVTDGKMGMGGGGACLQSTVRAQARPSVHVAVNNADCDRKLRVCVIDTISTSAALALGPLRNFTRFFR